MGLNQSRRNDNNKGFLNKLINLMMTHLNLILVLTFVVPWIYGQIAINDLSQVITAVEVFVLGSATLALVTFTYVSSMTNLDNEVKNSLVTAGESFFMATIQFIAGLSLFLLMNLLINKFIGPSDISLKFTWKNIILMFSALIQLIAIYEVASALSRFIKGIIEVYRQFRLNETFPQA